MKESKSIFSIREATINDSKIILDFIKKLAKYEKLLDEVVATEELVKNNIFNRNYANVIIAYVDNNPIGFALYFFNFSTFLCKPGLYIEDLFIDEEYRNLGYGKKLLEYLATIAINNDCGRMEWWVLNWNEPSIKFYKSIGAKSMDEWTVFRLTKDNLLELSSKSKPLD